MGTVRNKMRTNGNGNWRKLDKDNWKNAGTFKLKTQDLVTVIKLVR